MEHFSVYARPAFRLRETKTARIPTIDYKPSGSLKKSGNSVLKDFEILRAASDSATLRTPEGRVIRISRGSRIAGLGVVVAIERRGSDWTVETEAGVIR